MLPRFFTRKSRSYRQAINYALREQVKHGFVIKHNLKGTSPDEWVREFQSNENKRSQKATRKNAVRLRHIILPWHSKDEVSNAVMEDLTRIFMKMYSPHAMYLAVAHSPDESHPHPHVHIVLGGTDIFGRAMNLDKGPFLELKQKIEAYQREKYPELVHSQVEHGQGKRDRQSEYRARSRGKVLDKDKVKRILEQVYTEAGSQADFMERIGKAGLSTYTYRDKVNGVLFNGRKYRWRVFGLGRERFREFGRDSEWIE